MRAGRLVWVALAALVAVLGVAAPSVAHTELAESTPSSGTVVDEQPRQLRLRFTERLSRDLVQVVVTAPDGDNVVGGRPVVDGASVVVPLRGLDVAGRHKVAYRVMAADNHPVTGEFSFKVSSRAAAAPPAAEPVVGAQEAPAEVLSADATASSAAVPGPWVALVVALVGLLLSATISRVRAARRRHAPVQP